MNKLNNIIIGCFSLLVSFICSADSSGWLTYGLMFPDSKGESLNKVTIMFTAKKSSGFIQASPGKNINVKKYEEMSKEERFISKVLKVNTSGDKDGILSVWSEPERPDISKSMKSNEAFERNRAFFANIKSTKLIMVIRYTSFYMFFVEHELNGVGSYRKIYPAVLENDNYFMSNKLIGDYFYKRISMDILPHIQDAVVVK